MTIQTLRPATTAVLAKPNEWPLRGQWRYADYLRLPNDGRCYEIIEGVLYGANAPSIEHQFSV